MILSYRIQLLNKITSVKHLFKATEISYNMDHTIMPVGQRSKISVL